MSAKEHKNRVEKKFKKKGHSAFFLSLEKKRNVVRRRRKNKKNIKRSLSRLQNRESAHTHAPLAFDGLSSTFSSSSFIFIYVYTLKMRKNSFFASKKKKSEERKTKKKM